MRIACSRVPERVLFFGDAECDVLPQPDVDDLGLKPGGPEAALLSLSVLLDPACAYEALPAPVVYSRGAGPVLAARESIALDKLNDKRVGLPGEASTETMLAGTLLPSFLQVNVTDGDVAAALASGDIDAGLVWDAAQCDLETRGLVALEDLGARFAKYQAGLPAPLRAVGIRKDADDATKQAVGDVCQKALQRFAVDRAGVLAEIAEDLNVTTEIADAYVSRVFDPDARLDTGDVFEGVEVLREYRDADYYAANGRF